MFFESTIYTSTISPIDQPGMFCATVLLAGIILCIGAAFCSVVGITLQKKTHVSNLKLPEKLRFGNQLALEHSKLLNPAWGSYTDRKSYVKLPGWWMGLLGIILGAVLDFVSLGFAPQTVVASLGSMTLVINAVVAPIALKEKLARLEKFRSVCVCKELTRSDKPPNHSYLFHLNQTAPKLNSIEKCVYKVLTRN